MELKMLNEKSDKKIVDFMTEHEKLKASFKKHILQSRKDLNCPNKDIHDLNSSNQKAKDRDIYNELVKFSNETLHQENNKLKKLCDEQSKQINTLSKQNDEWKQQLNEAKKTFEDTSSSELERLKKMYEEQKNEKEILRNQYENIKTQLEEARKVIKLNDNESAQIRKTLSEEIKSLQEQNNKLNNQAIALSKEKEKIIVDNNQEKKISKEINILQEENSKLKTKLSEITTNLERMKSEVDSLRLQLEETHAKNKRLEEANEAFRKEIDKNANNRNSSENHKDVSDEYRKELELLMCEKRRLEAEVIDLQNLSEMYKVTLKVMQ